MIQQLLTTRNNIAQILILLIIALIQVNELDLLITAILIG